MGQDLLLKGVAAPLTHLQQVGFKFTHPQLKRHFATNLGLKIPEVPMTTLYGFETTCDLRITRPSPTG